MVALVGMPLTLVHASAGKDTADDKIPHCQHMQKNAQTQHKSCCSDKQQQHQCQNCDNCAHCVSATIFPTHLLKLHLMAKQRVEQLSATSLYGILPNHLLRPPRS